MGFEKLIHANDSWKDWHKYMCFLLVVTLTSDLDIYALCSDNLLNTTNIQGRFIKNFQYYSIVIEQIGTCLSDIFTDRQMDGQSARHGCRMSEQTALLPTMCKNNPQWVTKNKYKYVCYFWQVCYNTFVETASLKVSNQNLD